MRIRHTSRRLTALLTVLFLVWSPAAAIAVDEAPSEGDFDAHGHGSEEDLYQLDSASSAPGATFFNESAGCFESNGAKTPATTTNSTSSRSIPSNHQVRGPWGDFFGRVEN